MRKIKTISDHVIQLVHTFNPDLTHLNTFLTSSFYYLRIPKGIRLPTLLILHSKPAETETASNLQNQIVTNVDYVVGVSKATLGSYTHLYPDLSSHASVIYNSINLPSVEPRALEFESPDILGLGCLSNEKGFDIALDAFNVVQKRHTKTRLIIAGDGAERPALEEKARILGSAESVNFYGYVNYHRVPDLINQATIVILPSRHEQFGLVALEAAHMGRPVVASCIGGLKEIVIHQETGLLVKPTDSQGLADSIIFLIEHPDIATRYGKAVREMVQSTFSVLRFVENYERIYFDLVNKKTTRCSM